MFWCFLIIIVAAYISKIRVSYFGTMAIATFGFRIRGTNHGGHTLDPVANILICRPSVSYDGGMMNFKAITDHHKNDLNYDCLYFIDNDLFLTNVDELQGYIDEFREGDYDLVCHLVSKKQQDDYSFEDGRVISHVPEIDFVHGDVVPAPTPHWQTTHWLMSRRLWDALQVDEVGHHRKLVYAAHKLGAKFGSHYANYRDKLTAWGEEWFHIGNLMLYYYHVENASIHRCRTDKPSDMFRIGYFAAQTRAYGDEIYPQHIRNNLRQVYKHMGGRNAVLGLWDKWTASTCMEYKS